MTDAPPFDLAGVFDDDYLRFYGHGARSGAAARILSEERNDRDARLVAELAGIGPGTRVLDAPCGHGRIANRLAALGAEVVGLDLTPRFLEVAREDAAARGVTVDYREGDLRELDLDGGFDVVANLFTSIGYFGDEVDRDILRRLVRALDPGGRLVLETINRDQVVRLRALLPVDPVFLVQDGDDLMIDVIRSDPALTRTLTERIVVRDGRVRRTVFSARLFSSSELDLWLRAAGLTDVTFHDEDGAPFSSQSRRLVALGHRRCAQPPVLSRPPAG